LIGNRTNRSLFESLENRTMFAVGIVFTAPDMLTFTGNGANDTIIIDDNGAGVVSGQATNFFGVVTPFPAFAGIHRITINTNGGNDTVTYNLNGDPSTFNIVNAHLGVGNDAFKMNALADIDVFGNRTLDVRTFGEAGDDYIALYQRGEIDGYDYLVADGGDGQDILTHDIKVDAGSAGFLYAQSLGQMGDDKQSMLVRKVAFADPIFINAVASGGAGFDNITRTPWAINDATCEVVSVIP
jgi:hypothetical protein